MLQQRKFIPKNSTEFRRNAEKQGWVEDYSGSADNAFEIFLGRMSTAWMNLKNISQSNIKD